MDREGLSVNFRRIASWLPILLVPLLGVLILGWLLLVFAQRNGTNIFPSAEGVRTEYFSDHGGKFSVSDIDALPADAWQGMQDQTFYSCQMGEVLWLKVTFQNTAGRAMRGILENGDFFTDRVDAWLTDTESGSRQHLLSGEGIPADERAVKGRDIAFPVVVPAEGQQVVLLRIDDYYRAYVRLLWWPDEKEFYLAKMRGGQAEGIYFGGLLALLGYNLLLWARLRQSDVGYYVLYLAAVALFIALARAHLPEFGYELGSPRLELALSIIMMVGAIFLTLFARKFLELKRYLPKANMVAAIAIILKAQLLAAMLIFPEIKWLAPSIMVNGFTHVCLLVLSVTALFLGSGQARFFLLSFGCLFAGSLTMVAVWFLDTNFRETGMRVLMIGSGMEMLMLSLAVADRFARTQKKLIEETEQRRLIEETYADELEEEVRERTRELLVANSDKDRMLSIIGHDLRSPLTGIMMLADAESGRFAKDVARAGRTILLMIEDLVLWARLRAGTQAVSVHHATALMVPSVVLHQSLAEQTGLELNLNVPENLRVETDLVLAQTLVRNLLANALKFASTHVLLRAEAISSESVQITVSNDGPALSEAVIARISLKKDAPLTATGGLGLRLCQEICQALGIELNAGRSSAGLTEFSFIIKRAAAPADTPS